MSPARAVDRDGMVNSRAPGVLRCLALVLGAAGCIPLQTAMTPGAHSPFTGYVSETYRADAMWLCRPDLPANPCAAADLSATEILPDGSRRRVEHVAAKDPKIDCFFVYPTVDIDERPGNHSDFRDVTPMLRATIGQGARFQEVCRLFVPLYRQITAGTYAAPTWNLNTRLDIAFSDIQDAFAHYLGQHNGGRKVVLIGHSQGADMTVRLLRRFFDGDPLLMPRLLAGLPIGGRVETPPGERRGGTFRELPVCSKPEEIGCVVGFRSYADGTDVSGDAHGPPRGLESACVNPASVEANARAPLSRSFLRTVSANGLAFRGTAGIDTPFVLFRGIFTAQCVAGAAGYNHLAIAEARAPGDVRQAPFDLHDERFANTLGLHAFDIPLAFGDLIDMVARKAEAAAADSPR